jgi:Domain of unknown function (DUF6458)
VAERLNAAVLKTVRRANPVSGVRIPPLPLDRPFVRHVFDVLRTGSTNHMPLGTSIFLIAVGAILRYAVTATVSGISITTIGLILMIVGAAGIVLSLLYMVTLRPRWRGVMRERVVERDPYGDTY